MWYMGGKFRQGKIIAQFARKVLTPDRWYVEPFCGALGSACNVAHNKMVLSDVCKPLVLLWKGLHNKTYTIPNVITEDDYARLKKFRNNDDPTTALAGFGMSFGGKWFGGYARNSINLSDEQSSTDRLKRSITVKMRMLTGCNIKFCVGSYNKVTMPQNALVYCDPPYEKRTKAHAHESFNYDEFWNWCRQRSLVSSLLVTSFEVPDDFVVLHNWGDTVVRHHASKGSDGTCEVLACHESQAKRFFKPS